MDLFEKAYAELLKVEGGYSNNKNDTGGATMFGVTETVARRFGYTGAMKDLTMPVARELYRKMYWDPLRLDDIADISGPVALKLFDAGVNCGTGTVAKWLQRALNALNDEQVIYADIDVDGSVGNGTVKSLQTYMIVRKRGGTSVLLKALNCLQGAYYIGLAESRPANEDFVFGWLSNRVSLVEQ